MSVEKTTVLATKMPFICFKQLLAELMGGEEWIVVGREWRGRRKVGGDAEGRIHRKTVLQSISYFEEANSLIF